MKDLSLLPDFKHKKLLRIGVLLVSSLAILTASTLAYARVFVETPISVNTSSSTTAGPSSTPTTGLDLSLPMILVLLALGVTISFGLFGIQRQASRRAGSPRVRQVSPPIENESTIARSPPESDSSTLTSFTQDTEPSIEPEKSKEHRTIDEILQSLRKKTEETEENTESASTEFSQ
jgi:hypothetical protein